MSHRKEHRLFISKCLWVGGDLLALMWTEIEGAVPVTLPVFSQVHSPLLPALLCTSRHYISQAPLPLAGGWEGSVGSIHWKESRAWEAFWLSSCSSPCLLHGSNNCQTHPSPVVLGPGLWESLCHFQPREGKGFLVMLNLESSPFPPFGIRAGREGEFRGQI